MYTTTFCLMLLALCDPLADTNIRATESMMNIVIVLSNKLLVADQLTIGMVIKHIKGTQPVRLGIPIRYHIHIISAMMMKNVRTE